MKTFMFISWSGDRSKAVAGTLKDLVPDALQDVTPWMSDHDIDAGERWGPALDAELERSNFGILCLTSDNLDSPWLLFEAGSLAKSVRQARVVPYVLGLAASDISGPLTQFQIVVANEEGTFKLLESINRCKETPIADERLKRIFARWWPDFAARLDRIPDHVERERDPRGDRSILVEVLERVRSLERKPGKFVSEQLLTELTRQLAYEIGAKQKFAKVAGRPPDSDAIHQQISSTEQEMSDVWAEADKKLRKAISEFEHSSRKKTNE
jgi:hypothetical protein